MAMLPCGDKGESGMFSRIWGRGSEEDAGKE
jgi:hypothetical protein